MVLEQLVLGAAQGIAEWFPVSSEGVLVILQSYFASITLQDAIRYAIFLHIGTFMAALVYFRKDVIKIFNALLDYSNSSVEYKNILILLVVSTLVGGILGLGLLQLLGDTQSLIGPAVTGFVGLMLLATGVIQLRAKPSGLKTPGNLTLSDSILQGIVEGFSILPGISRSGITVSTFLLRGFDETTSLRLSMLMSLPAVLAANIVLNINALTTFTTDMLVGLIFSFLFGILTIHALLKLAKRINFGYFVILFGLLMIVAVFI